MGRLIDADELTEHMYREAVDTRTKIAELIKSAPTVDAIPVDWIQRYANACEAVSKTVGGIATKLSADAVNVMLDYWREEQKDARNHNTGVFQK